MNKVIEVLMNRDDMSFREARELIEDVKDMMMEDPMQADEIFMDELGLEPDYIVELF